MPRHLRSVRGLIIAGARRPSAVMPAPTPPKGYAYGRREGGWHVVARRGGERFVLGTFATEAQAQADAQRWREGGLEADEVRVERDCPRGGELGPWEETL